MGSERSAGLRSVAPAHQRRDALAQGEDDDQASRSGTRWYRSAGWWRCGRADGRGQVRGARCQSQSRQRRCAGVGTAAVEVVKADLLDPALSVPRSRGRMEPLSSPTSGIPRRCRVRPRSVRRPCKPPALPGSHRNLKMAKAELPSPSTISAPHLLWRVAVHCLQLAMGKGKGGRHIHLAAHDFDVGPGFAGAG